MRRLLTFAAFLLIISLVPVCAQRGGRASGGSHGGFSGGHGSGGSHASMGSHAFVGHGAGGPGFGGSHFSSRSGGMRFGHEGRSFGGHFGRGRFGRHGFRNGCIGCWGYGYPYYGYYAGIDPYWWWDSYSSYNEDDARERAEASRMNAENLDEQRSLREQDQDAYTRTVARPRESQSHATQQAENDPATVLVFRDQHQREIHNYAIVGQMLWSFGPQRTEKIPLASLDIPATEKANDERGVDFRVPRASEGQ